MTETVRTRLPLGFFFVLFAFLSLALSAGGYAYFQRMSDGIYAHQHGDLETIATLKINQLVAWRNERLEDVHFAASQPAFRTHVEQWLAHPSEPQGRARVTQDLNIIRELQGYEDALVADIHGRSLLASGPRMLDSEPYLAELSGRAVKERRAVLADLYRCESCGSIHFEAAAPIVDGRGNVLAVLVLRSDPEARLYPMIQAWPTPSETGEVLLVRQEAGLLRFLNRPRTGAGAVMTQTMLLTGEKAISTRGFGTAYGRYTGNDYRGATVLAHQAPVPDSPWALIAKVDKQEVLGEVRFRGGVVLAFTALGILLLGTLLALAFFFEQAKLYQDLFRATQFSPTVGAQEELKQVRRLRGVALWIGVFCVAMGGLTLAGWAFGLPTLTSILPGFVSMKANTALGLVLAGSTLGLQATLRVPKTAAWIGGGGLAALGLATLLQYILGADFGIDQVLFQEAAGALGTLSPGRMAPGTALAFTLSGTALVMSNHQRTRAAAQWIALVVGIIGLVVLLGNLYGPTGAYGIGLYLQIALHTAVGLVFLGTGILLLNPTEGFMRGSVSSTMGGWLLRRLAPFIIAVPILIGWARVIGEEHGWYEPSVGAALTITIFVVFLQASVWWAARSLDRIDRIRSQAELEVVQGAKEIRATLYGIGDGVISTDPEGRVLRMNPVAERLTGWTEGEAAGRPLGEVFHVVDETTRRAVDDPVACLIGEGRSTKLVDNALLIARDGTERAVADSGAPIFDEEGRLLRIVLVFRDQTAERAAQNALHSSEVKYRRLHEHMRDAFTMLDLEGRMLESNPLFLEMLGYTGDELRRMTYAELTPPAWRDLDDQVYRDEILKQGYSRVYEKELRRKDGSLLPVEVRVYLLTSEDGLPTGLWSVVRDISERKKAEALLRAKTELLDLTGRIAKVGGWEFDVHTLEGTWTDEVARIHDLDPAEGTNARLGMSFYTGEDRQRIAEAVNEAITHGTPYDLELELLSAKGVRKTVHTVGSPVFDAQHNVVQLRGIFQDITEKKNAELEIEATQVELKRLLAEADQSRLALLSLVEDLRASEDEVRRLNAGLEHRVRVRTIELEAANKELEAFAYSVSHDLRAPLRHMDGFLTMLAQHTGDQLDEKATHYLDVARKSAVHMSQLVDGLLSFSRLGRTELRVVPIEAARLVGSVIDEFKDECAQRNVRWELGTLPVLHGDPTLLRLVLQNLLGNALKFTRTRAEAVIELRTLDGLTDEAGLLIRDNGVGFDPAYGHKLFGVFQRLHREDEFEGTGIGLANVHRIISRHGGRVWAEGRLDEGATFYLTLPIPEREP